MNPIHQHDCDNCKYLGSDKDRNEDYYFCHRDGEHPIHSTLISRYGTEGSYSSGLSFVMSTKSLNKALKLAVEQNIIPDDVKEYIKKKQKDFFDYCEDDSSFAEAIAKEWEGTERFLIK